MAPTHAILDAARSEHILPVLAELKLDYGSLYDGYSAQSLAAVAPYLVKLPLDGDQIDRLVRCAWGNSWGIFLGCRKETDILRRHLRHFLMILDEQGEQVYFRYYDPRVLRKFLPSCLPDEVQSFFGPIHGFYLEGETSSDLLAFVLDENGLKKLSTQVEL
jgi:hypothetical protein